MLTKKIVVLGSNLASSARFNGKRILGVQNSILNKLVDSLVSLNETGSDDEIINQSVVNGTTSKLHADLEDDTAKVIAKVLSNIVDVAKNIVNPKCKEILARIEEARAEAKIRSVNLTGSIQPVDLPILFKDDMFLNLIEQYRLTPSEIIKDTSELMKRIEEDFTTEELNVLIKSGSAKLDEKIDDFIPDYDSLQFIPTDTIYISDLDVKESTLLFLLFTGIQQEKLDKAAVIMNDVDLKTQLIKIKASLAGRISREITYFETCVKRGDLIATKHFKSNVLDKNNVLYVIAPNYKNWLNTVGSAEAALGYLAEHRSGGNGLTEDTLLKEPEVYAKKFNLRLASINNEAIVNDIGLVRNTTEEFLSSEIFKMTDVDRAALQNKLKLALEHEYHGANDTTKYVIKVVCRTFTEGHDIKNLLLEMDSIIQSGEKVSLDTAVYLGKIRLVSKWIKSNLVVENIN